MKKFISLILLAAAVLTLSSCGRKSNTEVETFLYTGDATYETSTAENADTDIITDNSPKMVMNGESVKLNHPLKYKDGVLYAYINDYASAFGAHTVYSGKETIFCSSDTTVLIFKRGVPFFTVVSMLDGTSYALYLTADIQISDSKVYVSAIDIANGFGFTAKYYENTNTLVVSKIEETAWQ
ncbi:MAG: hypothetical protein IJT91_03030 [Clostridia bacterium]|nr:hypothetical protein [Clostridia bacterium]